MALHDPDLSGVLKPKSTSWSPVARAPTLLNRVAITGKWRPPDPFDDQQQSVAWFTVAPASVTKCVVTALANLPLGTAKKLLSLLNCKAGKVSKSSSSKVARTTLIVLDPAAKARLLPRQVGRDLSIPSGPKPKKHAKKKKWSAIAQDRPAA